MLAAKTERFVNEMWDDSIIPELCDYIRIPNKSPLFDPEWEAHGYMDEAVALMEKWCKAQPIKGMQLEVVRLPGRTPLIFIDIPGDSDDCVLLYGHLDKQPEFEGWAPDLDPWKPVIKNGRLYGRGGADDGYAIFGSLTAIRALQEQGLPHARCVVIIEACEESGSYDLPHYIEALTDRIGTPSLVVCLDAECGNYDQLWCTTSLRGNLVGSLSVNVLKEGVHSGAASGIVASSFRIVRELLSRIEDAKTGQILLEALHAPIPEERREQAEAAAAVLGDMVFNKLPFAAGTQPLPGGPVEAMLNSTWRPTLCVTGADGIPPLRSAGNVMRPYTNLKLSFRLPPPTDPEVAGEAVKATLEAEPPYNAKIDFKCESAMGGWTAPPVSDWLAESMQQASHMFFGTDAMYMGTGGSIPFMGMLGRKFPGVQFLVTGLLGPNSNAHGPNEFLHITKGKKLTSCVAKVLADHFTRSASKKAS